MKPIERLWNLPGLAAWSDVAYLAMAPLSIARAILLGV